MTQNSCTKGGNEPNAATFHVSHADDVRTLDPANAYDIFSWDVIPSIYETLYQYSYLSEPYTIEPLIAADLPKVSKDRLTLTIPLRRGIFFQDSPAFKATSGKGRELKAGDFIYAFKRLALPKLQSPGWWIFDNKVVGINDFKAQLQAASSKGASGDEELARAFQSEIAGFKALDDYTLQIKLTRPYPQLLFILSMPFTSPVAHEVIEAYGDKNGNIHDHPVGTGPFVLKTWDRGHRIVLERNTNYHPEFYPTTGNPKFKEMGLLADAGKTLPLLDRVVIDVIKEQQPAWLNFLSGKLDLQGVPKDNFDNAIVLGSTQSPGKADRTTSATKTSINTGVTGQGADLAQDLKAKGIRLHIETGTSFYYIAFNMKDSLLGRNKLLRQAMSTAINREKFIELFTNNRGIKATTALPPGIADRPSGTRLKYDYDVENAKRLLSKAGYPGGKNLPVINFDLRGANSVNRQMGEFISTQMAQIGIKLNVIYNTFPAFLEKAERGNLQVSYGGWVLDYPDAENVYQLLYGPNGAPGPNDANFNHAQMNELYSKMATLNAGPERAKIIAKMDDILQEEAPWALLYYTTEYRLAQGWVKNYRPSELILNRFKYYKIDKESKQVLLTQK